MERHIFIYDKWKSVDHQYNFYLSEKDEYRLNGFKSKRYMMEAARNVKNEISIEFLNLLFDNEEGNIIVSFFNSTDKINSLSEFDHYYQILKDKVRVYLQDYQNQ